MDLTEAAKRNIELLAEEALEVFRKVSDSAKEALQAAVPNPMNALANLNSLTGPGAVQNLSRIIQENREGYRTLTEEPAIARVGFVDGQGLRQTYFICRATPISAVPNLASYRSTKGRLASLPIGGELQVDGTVLTVVERALFRPSLSDRVWDGLENVIQGDGFGPLTVESLRSLLYAGGQPGAANDLLGKLFAEEGRAANIRDGIRRTVITKMGLRDQPILDQYQDEIFRLPLDKRLLILGPPGTGKTTTLIRRLGQKLDRESLGRDEQDIVGSAAVSNGEAHERSWLMFTPTDLLKLYLKEAFAREGLPASDLQVRTWSDYRKEIARGVLGVLRTATGSGFILKDTVETLTPAAVDRPTDWFSDFDAWHRSKFVDELRSAAALLSADPNGRISSIGQRLLLIVDRTGRDSLSDTFTSLVNETPNVQRLVAEQKGQTDKAVQAALNRQLHADSEFVNEMAKFIDGLGQGPDAEVDELEDQDGDEDEVGVPQTKRAAAAAAFLHAVRAQARSHASGRSLGEGTRNAKIIEWLGDRGLADADRSAVGVSLLLQASARRFANPIKRYLGAVPRLYRSFRRMRQEEQLWYAGDGFNRTDLHPLELDVLLLTILRGTGDLLKKPHIARDLDEVAWSALKPVQGLYKNQIVVDEATDFSPIQLACMAALAQPQIRSFFACGDFNQRLTTWGTRDVQGIKWVFPDIEVREMTVVYRQSRQLNELARAIVRASGGADRAATLPEHVNSEGVAPALLERASERTTVVDWLARQIREIERFVKELPSIAIFVDGEGEVQPFADALGVALADENMQVVACPKGQVMGQDRDVRVFDVEHIKGLEFEAVFFIGIDRLARRQPDLFDKYLYVGTTRAATYLGITCDDVLPNSISALRDMFIFDWTSRSV